MALNLCFCYRLSTTGVMVEIDRIVDVCARFRGPPCTITSPNVKPSGCEMLSDHFDRLNNCRVQLMRQVPLLSHNRKTILLWLDQRHTLYCLVHV